jgi:hypothetical protein
MLLLLLLHVSILRFFCILCTSSWDWYQICGLTDIGLWGFWVLAEGGDPLPGIEGLTIVGDAVLGGRLTACGHSVNGTSLCISQVFICNWQKQNYL